MRDELTNTVVYDRDYDQDEKTLAFDYGYLRKDGEIDQQGDFELAKKLEELFVGMEVSISDGDCVHMVTCIFGQSTDELWKIVEPMLIASGAVKWNSKQRGSCHG